ncbi:MAG: N-methylhydantoinase [Thermoleophilaceae bacterium]|jgi:N-methylhydantoinase B|nr:N-methylhydantoinase [Thermoleophilaceae bacterium]
MAVTETDQAGSALRDRVDLARLEVFRHYTIGTAEEAWQTLKRVAYSMNIKERGDCSSAIFTATGDMLAIPFNGVPLHQGSLEALVKEVLVRYRPEELHPGDIFITNDPYTGGTHTPDYCVVAPVFGKSGRLLAFIANVGHHSDVGGRVGCSIASDARSIFEEGLLVPPVRLCREGEIVEEVLAIICHNSRMRHERSGDIRAQISANLIGMRRLSDLIEEWGEDDFELYSQALLDYGDLRMRGLLETLPDGEWEAVDYIDSDGVGSDPLRLHLRMSKSGGELVLDFSGVPDQIEGGRNVPYTTLRATCFCVVRGLLEPNIALNSGFHRAVRCIAPEGSLVNPRHPAAVGDRAPVAQVLADMVANCVSQLLPDRALAATGCFQAWAFEGHDPRYGRDYAAYESIAGGLGATARADGIDAVRGWPLGSMNAPIEAFEQDLPVVFREYSLVPDSGGAGTFQGGLGMRRDVEIRGHDVRMTTYTMRQVIPPPGLLGGDPGRVGKFILNPGTPEERELPSVVTSWPLEYGDIVSCRTPGGGGLGPAAGRDGELIAKDLVAGRVTRAFTEEHYGDGGPVASG